MKIQQSVGEMIEARIVMHHWSRLLWAFVRYSTNCRSFEVEICAFCRRTLSVYDGKRNAEEDIRSRPKEELIEMKSND